MSVIELEANANIGQSGMLYGQSGSQELCKLLLHQPLIAQLARPLTYLSTAYPLLTSLFKAKAIVMSVDEENDLQMEAVVSPTNATSSNVTWSVENLTGQATIAFDTGLLTAISQGHFVKVTANSSDGSGIIGDTITINELYGV